jgi:hypothetical protein
MTADDATDYRIKRSLDSRSWSQIATLPADSTSFSDSGLAFETIFHYRVSASNSAGATTSEPASATTDTAPPAVHASDLDGSSSGKKRWSAIATVSVQDASGSSVAGAIVYGSCSTGQSGSCTTDSSGSCTIQQGGLRDASVDFTVTDIESASVYDPSANSDPDGDSDCTNISIAST